MQDQVDILYNKKFKFVDEYNQWKLPDLSNWFSRPEVNPPELAKFAEVKEQLNDVRSNLDDIELSSWSRHTHFSNRSGIVVSALRRDFEPEMCTQVRNVYGFVGCLDTVLNIHKIALVTIDTMRP